MNVRRTGEERSDSRNGNALVEFAVLLPFLLVLFVGFVDISMLLSRQINLVHISREAASFFSRGANFGETLNAIQDADGSLELDGPKGQVILSEISLDVGGQPIITGQQSMGGLGKASAVGTLPDGAPWVPATVPNGRTLPPGSSLSVVELFSLQEHFLGDLAIGAQGSIVLSSIASF